MAGINHIYLERNSWSVKKIHWRMFLIRIDSKRIRIIPSHCKICFRILLIQTLENQSDSIRFIPVQSEWIWAQIHSHRYGVKIGLDQSELGLIQIKRDSKSFSDLSRIIRNLSDSPGLNSFSKPSPGCYYCECWRVI